MIDWQKRAEVAEAKVAEQAEYMRLVAIECKNLMEFRDKAILTNNQQAAVIKQLEEALKAKGNGSN